MKPLPLALALAAVLASGFSGSAAEMTAEPRSRVFVLTDISNEPDDEESLVRFLVYASEYDIEGLIATTSTHLRNRTREDLIQRQLDAAQRPGATDTTVKQESRWQTAISVGRPTIAPSSCGGSSTAISKGRL